MNKMKKLVFLALLIGVFACNQEPGYKITVNLDGADGMVVLEKRDAGMYVVKDSATVSNGNAVLNGAVEFPELYYLSVKGKQNRLALFVENSDIVVSGKVDSIAVAKVTGSTSQDEFRSVVDQIQSVNKKAMALYQDSRKASASGDEAKATELMDQVNELVESTNVLQEDFIKNNPASYVSPFFLANIQYEKNVEELEALLNGFDPKLDSLPTVISLKERVEKMKSVAVGQQAPDFTQNDPEGNPITFSDIYSANEYTLLDFWASWCGPCRAENPNVVAVYNDYNDKGFTVFGVSLDRTKDDWLKGIEEDGLVWNHVSDLGYWSSAVPKEYAVNSIPANFLIDKEGKIVAKGLRGEDLRAKIAQLLN